MIAIIAAAVLLSVAAAGLAFFFQRSVLFPRPTALTRPSRGPAERVALASGSALFLPSGSDRQQPAPLLLFAHGNAETADQWVEPFAEATRRGWAVLLVEYPGYAGTAGSPSERSVVAAGIAAYDWASHDPRIDSKRIVVYGRSLGAGLAVHVAAARPVAGIVVESGFTSVRPLAARFLVPGFLVRDPFDNLAVLAGYHGPMLVLHGKTDEVIPIAHGEALAGAVPGATFLAMDCGHNDCPRPWVPVFDWLAVRIPARPARSDSQPPSA
jgi:fermentation-respiration switch protein FrsA (DUF1100 family)